MVNVIGLGYIGLPTALMMEISRNMITGSTSKRAANWLQV